MAIHKISKIRFQHPKVTMWTQITSFCWIILVSGVILKASHLSQVYTNVAQLSPQGLLMHAFIPHFHLWWLRGPICEPGQTGPTHVPCCRSAPWSGQGQSLGLSQWEDAAGRGGDAVELGAGRGKGGADGVTECLGTCHFVSALASTSGLHSLSPPAKYG